MNLAAVGKRTDVLFDTLLVIVNDEFKIIAPAEIITKGDHFPKFPLGIDMHERKREACLDRKPSGPGGP